MGQISAATGWFGMLSNTLGINKCDNAFIRENNELKYIPYQSVIIEYMAVRQNITTSIAPDHITYCLRSIKNTNFHYLLPQTISLVWHMKRLSLTYEWYPRYTISLYQMAGVYATIKIYRRYLSSVWFVGMAVQTWRWL